MRITSLNMKGIRSPIKRLKILHHLNRLKTDIALLQETHLKTPDFVRMKKLWMGTALGSEVVGRKAGVLILIHNNFPCEIIDTDDQGHFITAKLRLGNKDLQISSVYAPNSPGQSFFCELST